MYLELWRQIILNEPKLHWPLCLFQNTQNHYFEETLIPATKELAAKLHVLIAFQTCSLGSEYSMLQTSDDIIRTKLQASGYIRVLNFMQIGFCYCSVWAKKPRPTQKSRCIYIKKKKIGTQIRLRWLGHTHLHPRPPELCSVPFRT